MRQEKERTPLSEQQMERYQRNLWVEGFSAASQQRLREARVTVVGAGGLGSATLHYLVAAGVGHLRIVENDVVSLSNLQRQILYTTPQIGASKAEMAALRLRQLNPDCALQISSDRLTAENCEAELAGSDVVVDCTDNYATRYLIDDFCAAHQVPMVYGTAEQITGQVSVFHVPGAGSYRALYPEEPPQKPGVGVLSPIVGVVGSFEALEVVKWLTGIGTPLAGRLLCVDGRHMVCTVFQI
ncbi:MAG: HesA/MoeB/ThiF family protein [Alistipes sp.]|nr:HesA/MoeB/ThiF family protein [Alistipes sp.]